VGGQKCLPNGIHEKKQKMGLKGGYRRGGRKGGGRKPIEKKRRSRKLLSVQKGEIKTLMPKESKKKGIAGGREGRGGEGTRPNRGSHRYRGKKGQSTVPSGRKRMGKVDSRNSVTKKKEGKQVQRCSR